MTTLAPEIDDLEESFANDGDDQIHHGYPPGNDEIAFCGYKGTMLTGCGRQPFAPHCAKCGRFICAACRHIFMVEWRTGTRP